MEVLKSINYLLALPLRLLVYLYQLTVSPDHGLIRGLFPHGYCKFYPTCSAYAAIVLKEQGIKGLPKISRRLIACRPGVAGGVDLPKI
ncbi:MAG: membrane protein insertion efficiency factor YidD [Candidatus Doudnabacteria bacterium]